MQILLACRYEAKDIKEIYKRFQLIVPQVVEPYKQRP